MAESARQIKTRILVRLDRIKNREVEMKRVEPQSKVMVLMMLESSLGRGSAEQ